MKKLVKKKNVEKVVRPSLHTADFSLITGRIVDNIKAKLSLKDFQVEITTSNGVVFISGWIDSEESIERIQKIVSKVKEVKNFKSRLFVRKEK